MHSTAVCDICGKQFKNIQGLRGHEMFKCKAKNPAPANEEDSDTIHVSSRVQAYYHYLVDKGYEKTLEEFVDEAVTALFDIYARQKGIQLVLAEEIV